MRNNSDDAELLLLPQMGSEKIPSYRQVVQIAVSHFYLLGAIGDPEKYLDLVHTLKTAEEHDTIFIYINSVGGNLYTAIQIINAIQNCGGTVITCLEGEACSAATIIFLAGHKHIINPFGAFMVHKYSHGVEGKGSDVAVQVKFTERYFDELAYSIYADLMTKREIENMLEGKDLWLSSQEVQERLSKAGREILGSESDALTVAGSVSDVEMEEVEVTPIKARKSTSAKKTSLNRRK
ncbi:Clp protease [Xanthomonas phage Xoo-sp13]|nr:Clp protease [Xanthomonas phage Xoo-sp13]